jgi:DNA polymerase III subunit alpha
VQPSDFVHLHVHSAYSLLDGVTAPKRIVQRAIDLGQTAVALTDHGAMYGVVEFYQAALKAGIKPILGCETYVASRQHADKDKALDSSSYHLVLLARNADGYRNLIKLITIAHLEGFYYKPRVDHDLLAKFGDGLIGLSSCLGGEIPRAIASGNMDKARELVRLHQSHFGEDNFFLEVQHHPDLPEQEIVNNGIFRLSEEFGIPVVATNDSHYASTDDRDAQDILLCMQTGATRDQSERMSMMDGDYSLIPTEDMASFFPDHPEVITNTLLVAGKCNVEIELGVARLPGFETPDNKPSEIYLRELCEEGLKDHYPIRKLEGGTWELTEGHTEEDLPVPLNDIIDRLDFELSVIHGMGFDDYFLIVWDFIRYAKERDIVVGPGRGSAAGALVTYSLYITGIDPLKYDLLFERFLNPDRISMPDIDIDFDIEHRETIVEYVREKYGRDKVANVITYGTLQAKAAIKDVGRVLGLEYDDTDKLNKALPDTPKIDLEEALEKQPEFAKLYKERDEYREVVGFAQKLVGVTRHTSVHACAVVISDESLDQFTPLQQASRSDNMVITQYDAHALEELGLLKMDFLGLRNLTVIRKTVELIKKATGEELDVYTLPLDDPETYELFSRGGTTAVFQFESSGMKRYLQQLRPNRFDDIIAMVALYRPGPMQYIDSYCERKHGKAPVAFDHPLMEDALKATHGITIYQEQVMQMSRDLGGFTRGEADTLRKAMGKKDLDLMGKLKDKFMVGTAEHGIGEELAEKIWADWENFASYAFNKSHAACYAFIAYQTAYLKTHYTKEFLAADLSSEMDKSERVMVMIDECRRMGIEVRPPSVNDSELEFTVDGDGIRFGLKAVKNVGAGAIESMLSARTSGERFESLFDFCTRVDLKQINKRMMDSLIRAGAMDEFGERGQLIEGLDTAVNWASEEQANRASGQVSLFGGEGTDSVSKPTLPSAKPLSEKEKLDEERELLGFYVTGHPLDPWRKDVNLFCSHPSNALAELAPDMPLLIAGVISSVRQITTRNDKQMAIMTCEDFAGSYGVTIFPDAFEKCGEKAVVDTIVMIRGTRDRDEAKVVAEDIIPIENARQLLSRALDVTVASNRLTEDGIEDLKRLVDTNGGNVAVFLNIATQQHGTLRFRVKGKTLNPTDELLDELVAHPAVEDVKLEAPTIEKTPRQRPGRNGWRNGKNGRNGR